MLNSIVYNAANAIAQHINSNGTMVSACAVGLDARAGLLWICDDAIVTMTAQRLNYYGGFEYVDKQHVATVGDYTIYYADDARVQECIDTWQQKQAA